MISESVDSDKEYGVAARPVSASVVKFIIGLLVKAYL